MDTQDGHLLQVQGKVREREAAMQHAASAEDYVSAAAERDALNMLKLQQRRVELELDKEARIIRFEIGETTIKPTARVKPIVDSCRRFVVGCQGCSSAARHG
jgi:hypothetical protein